MLTGTIGQADTGTLSGGDFAIAGGYWSGPGQPAVPCPGDTNDDGVIDVADLLAVLGEWGICAPSCSGDTNDDGVVDVADLLSVLAGGGDC